MYRRQHDYRHVHVPTCGHMRTCRCTCASTCTPTCTQVSACVHRHMPASACTRLDPKSKPKTRIIDLEIGLLTKIIDLRSSILGKILIPTPKSSNPTPKTSSISRSVGSCSISRVKGGASPTFPSHVQAHTAAAAQAWERG